MAISFQSEHFTLHRLAEGVYAAIATEAGAGFSNAGLIDLGDQTLVFDAFENPQAAEDLLAASIQLTRRRPKAVVISHMHDDHWGGLQVFAGSDILATPITRKKMAPIARGMRKDKLRISEFEQEFHDMETRLATETDPDKRKVLRLTIARESHALQALPGLEPTLPNQTFDGMIIFHGARRSVELIATGKGHTESDCILNLPRDRITFIGDVGFFQSQPFMPYGYPPEWIALLNRLAAWNIKTFVPGHGPLGDKSDLLLEAEYIQAVEDMVRQVVASDGRVKDALRQVLPSPFDRWQSTGKRFEANVRASFKRHSRARQQAN